MCAPYGSSRQGEDPFTGKKRRKVWEMDDTTRKILVALFETSQRCQRLIQETTQKTAADRLAKFTMSQEASAFHDEIAGLGAISETSTRTGTRASTRPGTRGTALGSAGSARHAMSRAHFSRFEYALLFHSRGLDVHSRVLQFAFARFRDQQVGFGNLAVRPPGTPALKSAKVILSRSNIRIRTKTPEQRGITSAEDHAMQERMRELVRDGQSIQGIEYGAAVAARPARSSKAFNFQPSITVFAEIEIHLLFTKAAAHLDRRCSRLLFRFVDRTRPRAFSAAATPRKRKKGAAARKTPSRTRPRSAPSSRPSRR